MSVLEILTYTDINEQTSENPLFRVLWSNEWAQTAYAVQNIVCMGVRKPETIFDNFWI